MSRFSRSTYEVYRLPTEKGIEGFMIQSYMSSVRAVNIYKGYKCPAMKDGVVEAVIGGAKNRELGEVRGVSMKIVINCNR